MPARHVDSTAKNVFKISLGTEVTSPIRWFAKLDDNIDVAILRGLIPGESSEQRHFGYTEPLVQSLLMAPKKLQDILVAQFRFHRHHVALIFGDPPNQVRSHKSLHNKNTIP